MGCRNLSRDHESRGALKQLISMEMIELPTSNIERPTSKADFSLPPDVGCSAFDVRCWKFALILVAQFAVGNTGKCVYISGMSLFRMKRVNEQVKRELSNLIREQLPVEKHGLISVTDVDVSKDLKAANVYISTVGTTPQMKNVIQALEKARHSLQHDLSKKIVMKYTPHLLFRMDQGIERGQHLVELLDTLDEKKD